MFSAPSITQPDVRAPLPHPEYRRREFPRRPQLGFHEANIGDFFETIEVAKVVKDGKAETDKAGNVLTVKKERPRTLLSFPVSPKAVGGAQEIRFCTERDQRRRQDALIRGGAGLDLRLARTPQALLRSRLDYLPV